MTQTFRLHDGKGNFIDIEADTPDELRDKVMSAMSLLGWDYEIAGVEKIKAGDE